MPFHYNKGAAFERDLQKRFEYAGFKVVRAAGSGVAGDTPDLIVLSTTRKFAIESKAWNASVYVERVRFAQMLEWEKTSGIPYYVAWKVFRKEWRFFPLSALRETPMSYVVGEGDLVTGMTFSQLVGKEAKA
ncbi:hypothetical protein HY995_04785 [Candidatus Micrarchaeota archaeon]|nr:hypothetical protein [Candidatus Micrarchaeota archaeon]MBI5177371.1 hypothetical protein [Candidatus Micrarchaeota archaeon]